ncbi:MAG: 2-phosphosulfolactate phosphatase [Acidimicrobiia bacterium]|nr:2-phosphosulfolactate phosphatase [Acidimicrobiia bacterium]
MTARQLKSRQLKRWELDGVSGAVVVIDVIRAFSTAAYAFGSGAAAIYLVSGVDEALRFKDRHSGVLAMGEDHGLRPDGFDFPNSPASVSRADLDGRTLVQRTSAGTQGVVNATSATRLWAASLACGSSTARAVEDSGLGDPAYVITGCFPDRPDDSGGDDRLTAEYIERVRVGQTPDAEATGRALLATDEARRTRLLPREHCDPTDIELAAHVDAFDFAMEVVRDERGLRLEPTRP